jgi:hypothetical protein
MPHMATLTIHDRTATGRPVDELTIEGLPDRITVRDLIRTRVREEVARYNLKPIELYRGLVTPTDAEATLNGSRLRQPRRLDWEAQATVAETAFQGNGFFLLVNGRQATELDEEIDLAGANDVAFVRLLPLVGG